MELNEFFKEKQKVENELNRILNNFIYRTTHVDKNILNVDVKVSDGEKGSKHIELIVKL